MINIEAFPASYGQSILVSFGKNELTKNILIDVGFISTYNNYIKDKLMELKKSNLMLDLLVFTHFDADHISGGIKLLKDNVNSKDSKIVNINNIWINRLKHMNFDKNISFSMSKSDEIALRNILKRKYPNELYRRTLNNISAEQCLTLSKLIDDGGYENNKNSIIVDENFINNTIYLDKNIKIIIVSPTKYKLDKLKNIWIQELIKIGINKQFDNNQELAEAFEKIMVNITEKKNKKFLKDCSSSKNIIDKIMQNDIFKEDESDINGSSIAFIIEFKQKRLLFLGDSHPTIIKKYINNKLKYINNKRLKFDLINISHHGSCGNTSLELLNLVECSKFLICTNGKKFGHPDKETLARIIFSNKDIFKEIYLNYEVYSIKKFLNKELMEKYNYSINFTNKISNSNKSLKSTHINI